MLFFGVVNLHAIFFYNRVKIHNNISTLHKFYFYDSSNVHCHLKYSPLGKNIFGKNKTLKEKKFIQKNGLEKYKPILNYSL